MTEVVTGKSAALPSRAFTIPDQVSFRLQDENRPVGGFSLRGSLVSALEDNGVPTGKGQLQPEGLRGLPPALSMILCCQRTELWESSRVFLTRW